MDPRETQLSELTEPAPRAGAVGNGHSSIVDLAERQAEEILRAAERDALETRRAAMESAKRVFERIEALERPLGELVDALRLEVEGVEKEIDGRVGVAPLAIASGRHSADTAPPESGSAPDEQAAAAEPRETDIPQEQRAPAAEQEPDKTGRVFSRACGAAARRTPSSPPRGTAPCAGRPSWPGARTACSRVPGR